MSDRIDNFAAFWRFYLREHASVWTRRVHIAGTVSAFALLVAAVVLFNGWLVLAAIIAGYGPAFATHFVIEKNRPVTFRYPLWSLAADIHMTFAWLAGQLTAELQGAGVVPPKIGS